MEKFNVFVSTNVSLPAAKLTRVLDRLLSDKIETHAVHLLVDVGRNGNFGASMYAETNGLTSELVPAAPPHEPLSPAEKKRAAKRTERLAAADAFAVFWDGQPGQTQRLIAWAQSQGKPVRVIK